MGWGFWKVGFKFHEKIKNEIVATIRKKSC
jgi:hypothetical protein